MKKIKLMSAKEKELALQEGQALFELRHPNLVHAIAFYEKKHWFKQNKVGIIMEYCDGGNLGKVIESGVVLSEDQILSVVLQVSAGLVYLHDKGILHRDIKPENILLQRITPTTTTSTASSHPCLSSPPASLRAPPPSTSTFPPASTNDVPHSCSAASSNPPLATTPEMLLLDGLLYRVKISDLGLIAKLAPLEDMELNESLSYRSSSSSFVITEDGGAEGGAGDSGGGGIGGGGGGATNTCSNGDGARDGARLPARGEGGGAGSQPASSTPSPISSHRASPVPGAPIILPRLSVPAHAFPSGTAPPASAATHVNTAATTVGATHTPAPTAADHKRRSPNIFTLIDSSKTTKAAKNK